MVPEPWQLLAAQSLPGFGPGGPESIAADPAAKIKFDSCMHPVLIRWRVIQKRQPLSIYGEASIKELVIESLLKTNERSKMKKNSSRLLKLKLWRSKQLSKIKTGIIDILFRRLRQLEKRNETLNKIIDQLAEGVN